MDTPPLRAARALRTAGHAVTLLLSAQTGPYGRRSLLAIDPDDAIVSPPGAGAGLPAIPPRLVHTAQGRGVWIGAISYDAGLGLHGIASRHEPVVPALVAGYHATYAVLRPRARHVVDRGRARRRPRGAGRGDAGERRAAVGRALPAPRSARSPVTRGSMPPPAARCSG